MYINLFASYPALAQVLCLLLVAGIIGYFFGHLITSRKLGVKQKIYDQKMGKIEEQLNELELVKDKQSLLFASKKELTDKVNELDALLSLTSEVESISKSLNSLNFVPYSEFHENMNKQIKEIELFKKQNTEVFNNYLEKSNQDIKQITESIPLEINKFVESFDWKNLFANNEIEVSKTSLSISPPELEASEPLQASSQPTVDQSKTQLLADEENTGSLPVDDLKLIKGIGPILEKKLHEFGIYTFEQISQLSSDDFQEIEVAIRTTKGKIGKEKWVEQAQALWDESKKVG